MSCLLLAIGLFLPRVAIVLLWLFSDWIGRAFDGWVIPLLGFLLMPYTTLWYAFVRGGGGTAEWGFWQILLLVLALMMDFSSHGWFARRRRREPRD
jgi:hypothetical protein